MDDSKIPEDGIPFFDAWEILSTERERREWRNAIDKSAWAARSLLMQANLIYHLKHGDLAAFGIRVHDASYQGAERIPALLFDDHIEIVKEVFSATDNRVRLAGRIWMSVVVRSGVRDEPTTFGQIEKPPAVMGRPRIDSTLDGVVESLSANNLLTGISRKQQETIVREHAQKRYPELFPTPKRPSRGKILEALARRGFSGKAAGSESP